MTIRIRLIVTYENSVPKIEAKSCFNHSDPVEVPHYNNGFDNQDDQTQERTKLVWIARDPTAGSSAGGALRFHPTASAALKIFSDAAKTRRAENDTNPDGTNIFGTVQRPSARKLTILVTNKNSVGAGGNPMEYPYTVMTQYRAAGSVNWQDVAIDPRIANIGEY